MNFEKLQKATLLAEHQKKTAEKYADHREKSSKAKTDLDLLLTVKFADIRFDKPNCGIETAYIMLMERDSLAKELYKEWQLNEGKYKGLERLLEAQATELMLYMAILKRQTEGEKWGN